MFIDSFIVRLLLFLRVFFSLFPPPVSYSILSYSASSWAFAVCEIESLIKMAKHGRTDCSDWQTYARYSISDQGTEMVSTSSCYNWNESSFVKEIQIHIAEQLHLLQCMLDTFKQAYKVSRWYNVTFPCIVRLKLSPQQKYSRLSVL
jgi:hypothetical protein